MCEEVHAAGIQPTLVEPGVAQLDGREGQSATERVREDFVPKGHALRNVHSADVNDGVGLGKSVVDPDPGGLDGVGAGLEAALENSCVMELHPQPGSVRLQRHLPLSEKHYNRRLHAFESIQHLRNDFRTLAYRTLMLFIAFIQPICLMTPATE